MATYRKRGDAWRVEIHVGDVRESATFDTKAAAVAWGTLNEGELRAKRRGEIIQRSVRQALERYAAKVSPTHEGERWERVRLLKFEKREATKGGLAFIDKRMQDVSKADITDWRDALLDNLKPGSALREYGLLRAVFNVARDEWGWVQHSPFATVTPPPEGKPRKRRISDDEILQLCLALNYEPGQVPSTASQYIATAMLWAVETAMRKGELLGLDDESIDERRAIAQLTKTKNGDERTVPLSSRAVALLKVLPKAGPLFLVGSGTCDTLFRRARENAGLVDLHFHDLRREATTRMAKRIDNPLLLAKITGHRDVNLLMRVYYAPDMSAAAALLD